MNKIITSMAPALITICLAACGGSESADMMAATAPMPVEPLDAGDQLVYESRQSLQCGTRGLTIQQSAQKLIRGGIDVTSSSCGIITKFTYPAVCGGATGEILIHQIRNVNLPDAERLGFKSVDSLLAADIGPAPGYVKVDCQTGAVLP